MDSNLLSENLQACLDSRKGPRISRLLKSPLRIIYSELLKHVARVTGRSFRVYARTFWGKKLLLVLPESVSESIYRYGYFEEGLTQMILSHLKKDSVFFDVGAHFGYFTLLASDLVGLNGQVHSFEPTPSTFSVLSKNSENIKNITLNNLAVYSNETKVTIADYGVKYSSFNSIYKGRLPESLSNTLKPKEFTINAISVDSYVRDNKLRPDFVKIDAESAELRIVEGMMDTISACRPIISIEVGDKGGGDVPSSKEIVALLRSKGYVPYEYAGAATFRPHLHVDSQPYTYDNIFFIPV